MDLLAVKNRFYLAFCALLNNMLSNRRRKVRLSDDDVELNSSEPQPPSNPGSGNTYCIVTEDGTRLMVNRETFDRVGPGPGAGKHRG